MGFIASQFTVLSLLLIPWLHYPHLSQKTEAEEVRQNCETLNNILLSEFDYFSNHLVNDFPAMIQRLLLQQSNFHRKVYYIYYRCNITKMKVR